MGHEDSRQAQRSPTDFSQVLFLMLCSRPFFPLCLWSPPLPAPGTSVLRECFSQWQATSIPVLIWGDPLNLALSADHGQFLLSGLRKLYQGDSSCTACQSSLDLKAI